jgi:uncharacterized membrane protein YwzB
MPLLQFVVVVLVVAVLYWALQRVLIALKVADPIYTIVLVVFVLLAVAWVLNVLGFLGPPGLFR